MYRKSIPQVIYEWAFDIAGEEARALAVINELLPHYEAITSLWENNQAYNDLNYAIIKFQFDCKAFGPFEKLEQYLQSKEYQEVMNRVLAKGDSYAEARKRVVRYFAILSDLEIHEEKAFQAFYQKFNDLNRAKINLENVKRIIISEHWEEIFNHCRFIDLIKMQNAIYSKVVGEKVYVENILGEHGVKLGNGDNNAINYVFSLEDEEQQLKNRKAVLESNNWSRK